jgi:hypothetical protein
MNAISRLLLNTLTFAFAIFFNYWANSGKATGTTIRELSDKYDSLITPAPYAFSIWGLIFMMLFSFIAFQWYEWIRFKKKDNLEKCGFWFAISNICNGIWTYIWLLEMPLLSVLIMLVLLFSLIKLAISLRLEIWDAPLSVILFVWWPICLYLGWIILATVVNISSTLVSLGWTGAPFSEQTWTIVMIAIATVVYLFLTKTRNMREASLVGIWGLVGIIKKQNGGNDSIVYTAEIAIAILCISVLIHAFRNRKTSPMEKIKNKEF